MRTGGGGRNSLITRVLSGEKFFKLHFGFTLAEGATHVDNFANKRKFGFTLAEVLITLGIIGVVAAITIPIVIQNGRKVERINQIKTAYSIIQNATRMAVAEHGSPDSWDFENSLTYATSYFIPYVKVIKLCGQSTNKNQFYESGCFVDNGKNGEWYRLNGESYETGEAGGYKNIWYCTLVMANGMHVAIWAPAKVNQAFQRTICFSVDVNGGKGPSTLGKDIFTFRYNIDTEKFMTGGSPSGGINKDDCVLTGKGASCAYIIEQNNWKIPDNYPVKRF